MTYHYLVTLDVSSYLPPEEFMDSLMCEWNDNDGKTKLDGFITFTRVHLSTNFRTVKEIIKYSNKAYRVARKEHLSELKELIK